MPPFELPHGRGPPRAHHGRHDYARDSSRHLNYNERQPSRRSLEDPRYDAEQLQGGRDRRTANRHHRRRSKVPFEPAMEDLCVGLETAVSFLRHFDRQFDMETQGIRAYAGRDIVELLWIAKVKASDKHPHQDRNGESDRMNPGASYGDHGNEQGMPAPGFQAMWHSLRQQLIIALSATPPSRYLRSDRDSAVEHESTQRLLKKLSSASKDLDNLASKSIKHHGLLQELVKEAELVHGYLVKSRQLWQTQSGEGGSSRVEGATSGYEHGGAGGYDDEPHGGSEGGDVTEPQHGGDNQW
ncbi:MAG: hypothetical protein M1812_004765 [Candelaria pacifica]|nr:MAG: hypothetical protein M1812_004765 [Candelaria pacifica]